MVALAAVATGCATKSAGRLTTTTSPTVTTKPADPATAPVQLLATDGKAGDNLGGAVWYDTFNPPPQPQYYATPGEAALSSDGSVALVGAPGHTASPTRPGAGAAYLYEKTNGRW